MLRTILELVQTWWRADRIRISPAEGRLLRLKKGSVVKVRTLACVVRHRWSGRAATGPYVAYDCEGEAGPFQLRVHPAGECGPLSITCTLGGKEDALPPEDIEVFDAGRRE